MSSLLTCSMVALPKCNCNRIIVGNNTMNPSESSKQPNAVLASSEREVKKNDEVELIPFATFLESHPPSKTVAVSNIITERHTPIATMGQYISTPDIELFCDHEKCKGNRVYRTTNSSIELRTSPTSHYITYICSNCQRTAKEYSLQLRLGSTSKGHLDGFAYKFGELPPFGPRIPSKLITLIRPDREDFFKGRRCESQGLGVGAFAYYRRIVERQKHRILDEIIRVAKRVSAADETLSALEAAKDETQFSKAVGMVKQAIPQALLINGKNPLTLLHAALSKGLHTQDDDKCLEAAHDIRIVLAELAERLGQALKDEAELNAAVTRLTKQESVK